MLIDRVRRALAPDYEILEEVAAGGMGIVFAARHCRLERKVAIKILRPELATAVAVERFLGEGRLLAKLTHPNIVPIYDAGEADGLIYYVMEYIVGETLAQRLARGPLSPADSVQLARDLLAALGAAHALGVVHRDVKPANLFLRDGRALLGDFGIAWWREEHRELTSDGQLLGTVRYMTPEQYEGAPATPRTDVYAAGIVIWEAASGEVWPRYQEPSTVDWGKVPPLLAGPLRRALTLESDGRWTDAREFALALVEAAVPSRRRKLVVLAGAAVAAAAAAIAGSLLVPRAPALAPASGFVVDLGRITVSGAGASLADSLSAYLRNSLAGPDVYVTSQASSGKLPAGSLRLSGLLEVSSDSLRIQIEERNPATGRASIHAGASGLSGGWLNLADTVASQLVFQIWQRAANDRFFPANVIPAGAVQRALLARAEQFFSLGRWEEAAGAYADADKDVSCLLCAFRSLDLARWFGLPQDPRQLARLQRAQDSFPEQYRALIHAAGMPSQQRLDTLRLAAQTYGGFYLASFEYGDELLHRGPLHGRLRSEGIEPLRTVVQSQPRFTPAVEHLAWLLISEGDSVGAGRELAALSAQASSSELSSALTLLRSLGYHWRFLSPDSARRFSQWVLQSPAIRANRDALAGARLLMSMDVPRGAVELGELFVNWREVPGAAVPGLLGRLYGFAALGQLDSVRATGKRFSRITSDPGYPLLALELEAVLRGFDSTTTAAELESLRAELVAHSRRVAADPKLRLRTTWALGLLAARTDDRPALKEARRRLSTEPDSFAVPLARLLEAAELAHREPARALSLLAVIPALDLEPEYADPLEDAVAHLLAAELQQRLDSSARAAHTLRWHEHAQLSRHLLGEPQAGEVGWAVGTLARWRRAQLLASLGDQGKEWCSVNRGVARLWEEGDSLYRARAVLAKQVLASPSCAAAP